MSAKKHILHHIALGVVMSSGSRYSEIAVFTAAHACQHYGVALRCVMVIIRFPDEEAKRRALGCLPGRHSGKSWATGEMMVPEEALGFLAHQGIRFTVEGPATYEQIASLRVPAAAEVQ